MIKVLLKYKMVQLHMHWTCQLSWTILVFPKLLLYKLWEYRLYLTKLISKHFLNQKPSPKTSDGTPKHPRNYTWRIRCLGMGWSDRHPIPANGIDSSTRGNKKQMKSFLTKMKTVKKMLQNFLKQLCPVKNRQEKEKGMTNLTHHLEGLDFSPLLWSVLLTKDSKSEHLCISFNSLKLPRF